MSEYYEEGELGPGDLSVGTVNTTSFAGGEELHDAELDNLRAQTELYAAQAGLFSALTSLAERLLPGE